MIVANLIAFPLAFYVMNEWLDSFAFQITMNQLYFIGSGQITAFGALLTMRKRAWSAANSNPIIALMSE